MVNCQSCGAVNNEDSLSCVACNRTLQVVCPQCTGRNQISAAVCNQCGRILNEKNDPKLFKQKTGDPVAEMYEKPVPNPFTTHYPKDAFLKVVLGGFIFALAAAPDGICARQQRRRLGVGQVAQDMREGAIRVSSGVHLPLRTASPTRPAP